MYIFNLPSYSATVIKSSLFLLHNFRNKGFEGYREIKQQTLLLLHLAKMEPVLPLERASYPTDLYPQEQILKAQRERQQMPLLQQRDEYENWFRDEKKLLNKTLLAYNFSETSHPAETLDYAKFFPGITGGQMKAEVLGNWNPAEFQSSTNGLQIRSLILKTRRLLTLKSLAVEVTLYFRLVGESTLWILSRATDINDPGVVICKVRKEQECQRAFLIFGAPVGPNSEFRFFRKQEIVNPSQESQESQFYDFIDIRVTYIDNGDDRVWVTGHSEG